MRCTRYNVVLTSSGASSQSAATHDANNQSRVEEYTGRKEINKRSLSQKISTPHKRWIIRLVYLKAHTSGPLKIILPTKLSMATGRARGPELVVKMESDQERTPRSKSSNGRKFS